MPAMSHLGQSVSATTAATTSSSVGRHAAEATLDHALNGLLVALTHALPSTTCRDGPSLAVELFGRMALSGHRASAPIIHTYGIVIDCCRRDHRADLTLAFVACLLRMGLRLGVIMLSNLLKGLCDARRSQQAREMLRMMTKGGVAAPNVFAYNIAIDGFFKEGEVEKACGLFHEMKEQRISSDAVTYNSIINALCKSKAMDKAERVLEEMVLDGVRPDSMTYNCLIHGYSLGILMVSNGIVPDHHVFNMLIDTYAKCGMMDEAMHIFEDMQKQGVNPDVVTYTTVISSFCRMGRLADAVDKFNEMTDLGVSPDLVVYQCLIHATYAMKESAITYGTFVNGYCKNERIDDALTLFRQMLCKGVEPNIVIYNILLDGLFHAKRIAAAKKMFHEMIRSRITMDIVTYSTILCGLYKNNCIHEAITLFQKLWATNVIFDTRALNIMIKAMLDAKRLKQVKDLFAAISAKGLEPSVETYRLMMRNLIKEGFLEEVEQYLLINGED
ncbi:hypothetical protein ABZP36_007071 [Zizania latifolia]